MSERGFSAERITGAALWRLAFLGVQAGGSVILFGVLGHILHRHAFAATAVTQGVLVIAQAIGDFGLSQAAVTVLPARSAARPESAEELFAGAARAYLYAAALGLVLTLVAVGVVPSAAAAPVAVSAPATAAMVIVSGADGILRAQGEFRRPVRLMAASELAGFAGVPVALATHSALWTCTAISAAMTLGAAGSVAVLVEVTRRHRAASPRQFARASTPLGLAQVFIALATRADTLLAGTVSGLLAAGTFEGSWRVYQLSQYGAGALASATAPFVADALGAGRHTDALRILRRLALQLLAVGIAGGVVLYLARHPISELLTGSLSGPVARALPPLALISPLAAVGLIGFFTLIALDGQRRYVLTVSAFGAAVNIAIAAPLAASDAARGVVIGCAIGLAVINLLLLARLGQVIRGMR